MSRELSSATAREALIAYLDNKAFSLECCDSTNTYAEAQKYRRWIAALQPGADARELHDRLGSMIDQVGHPDYSLRELVKGLREVRDDLVRIDTPPFTDDSLTAASLIYEDCRERGQSREESLRKATQRLICSAERRVDVTDIEIRNEGGQVAYLLVMGERVDLEPDKAINLKVETPQSATRESSTEE